MRYIILAKNEGAAIAYRNILWLSWPEECKRPIELKDVQIIALDDIGLSLTPDQQFDHIAVRILSVSHGDGQGIPVGQITIIVDSLNLCRANPLSEFGWDTTLGMLILAFPEVQWLFGSLKGTQGDTEKLSRWHSTALLRHGLRADPLFDGSGLRNAIRRLIVNEEYEGKKVAPYVPIRTLVAAALDDEESYAYFNAFTAYRFGFKAFPIFRNAMAEALFRNAQTGLFVPHLTFEDIYLSFPDNTDHQHYSDLGSDNESSRKMRLPGLEKVCYRIFVTTEHRHIGDDVKHDRNHKYIDSNECVCNASAFFKRYGKTVLKPYSGMFDLMEKSELAQRLQRTDKNEWNRLGFAQGFVWPPLGTTAAPNDTGHSAPGRLLQIATHMITRCEGMLQAGVYTVPDAVCCAVLATDALELLGGRTPTTSMDALKLKHMAEVIAECGFSGVEYHIEIKDRFKEIQEVAGSISCWFHPDKKAEAILNAEMTTILELMRIFRGHGQFDEAFECQNRVRFLHNRLRIRQNPLRRFFWPLYKYTEVVLASFGWFLTAILGWLLLYAGLFRWIGNLRNLPALGPKILNSSSPLEQAFTSFTGTSAFSSADFCWNFITVCAVFTGIAHIGIFISHLYVLVSRKD